MKYQLHCPNCHHEFAYDKDYYDRNIARLGMEIHNLVKQLENHRLLSWPEQKRRSDWFFRTKRTVAEKQEELAGLKAIRKVADQQVKFAEHQTFKRIVKERYGETAYKEIIAEMEAEIEAYKVSGLMWHEYTRSNAKSNVTSINKL